MRKKWIFTGAAFALAMTLTGCRDNAAASIPQQSSQEQAKEQTQMIYGGGTGSGVKSSGY